MSNQFFFDPFKHKASSEIYSHEHFNIGNPVVMADTEHKAIWPDAPSNFPDLLIWIGTGIADKSFSPPGKMGSRMPSLKPVKNRLSKSKAKQFVRRSVEERHDKFWDDYLNALPHDAPTSHFLRLNVKVPETPISDDIDSIHSFQNMARKCIDDGEISVLASRLFATFFYFEGEIKETTTKELFLKGEV